MRHATLMQALQFGQLHLAVDAQCFGDIVRLRGHHLNTVGEARAMMSVR